MNTMNEYKGHFERPTLKKQDFPAARRSIYLIGVIIIGFLSGALGSILIDSLYSRGFSAVSYQQSLQAQKSVIVVDKNPLTSLLEQSEDFIVPLFKKTQHGSDGYSRLPDPLLYVGSGAIITSDGWIMVESSLLSSSGSYEVYRGGMYYPILTRAIDSYTGATFVKVDAIDFNAAELTLSPLVEGQQIFFVNNKDLNVPRLGIVYVGQTPYVTSASKLDYILSSDQLGSYAYAILNGNVVHINSYIFFDFSGKITALGVVRKGMPLLIPAQQLKLSFEQSLREEKNRDLGIFYRYNNIADTIDSQRTVGITIDHPTKSPIKPASLAERYQLRKGDIITAINGEEINATNLFDYVWRKYQNNDSVTLSISRNGTPGLIEITK